MDVYFTVKTKFIFAFTIASVWLILCAWLSIPWILDLAALITIVPAVIIVTSIALIPGFMYMFLVVSYMVDKRKTKHFVGEYPGVTLLVAAYNEENYIEATLLAIKKQDYAGELQVILIDDGSTDQTINVASSISLSTLQIEQAHHGGKAAALNYGLTFAKHDLIITIDADTYLAKDAIRQIVRKLCMAPQGTVAVAGSVYVRNSRKNWITKIQEWDYFHAIAVIKRTQSLFQGTLVAQGAFSIYRKNVLVEIGGWPETVGEDIVLTWGMLSKGYRIDFAEHAISFTNVPNTYKQFFFQRCRWARGVFEAFRAYPELLIKPRLSTFYIYWNLAFIGMDPIFFFVFIPGLIAAFFGYYFIAGPLTLAVLPIGLLNNIIFYVGQRRLFKQVGLMVRRNFVGFMVYFLLYQIIMNPAVVYGYLSELLKFKRSWGTK